MRSFCVFPTKRSRGRTGTYTTYTRETNGSGSVSAAIGSVSGAAKYIIRTEKEWIRFPNKVPCIITVFKGRILCKFYMEFIVVYI